MTDYIDVDVRPILRAGGEPFSVIMSALQGLEPGQGLRLYATFKPIPLFAVMEKKGFAHAEQALEGGEWEVLFTPGEPRPEEVAAAGSSFDNWPAPAVTLDNRDLDPPELRENIVDLGFVYDIAVEAGAVRITMTATTPGCPATGFLREGAQAAASAVPGVVSADVE